MTKKLPKTTLAQKLLLLLPAVLYLSAFPALTLGTNPTMNLELSLPELWLALFSVVCLINFIKTRKPLKILLATALFPAYASLSVIWSSNRLRATLTAALIWLLWFSIINIVVILTTSSPRYKHKLFKIFQLSTFFACAFCWLQCFANVFFGHNLLLCAGCTYQSFGFPHPNGFTLEPQFMGNLLLAPALLSLCYPSFKKPFLTKKFLKNLPQNFLSFGKSSRKNLLLSIFVITTLFLTFSRGAIFAFLLGTLVIFALNFHLKNPTTSKTRFKNPAISALNPLRPSLLQFSIIIVSFTIALSAQGIFATFSPTSDTFTSGITKSIHHLSLGHLDFRPDNIKSPSPQAQPLSELPQATSEKPQAQSNLPQALSDQPQAQFTGYIPESTDIRTHLNSLALDRWNDDIKIILFGTGLGSAGTELSEALGTPKEIIQNEYISLLLELGFTAYAILALIILILTKTMAIKNHPAKLKPLVPLLTAYAFSLLFFSGLPNALHIYLLPPLLASLFQPLSAQPPNAQTPNAQPLNAQPPNAHSAKPQTPTSHKTHNSKP